MNTNDEKKMLKAAAMGAELRQGRYFKISRVVKSFEDIDDYCDQQESKGNTQDTILKWMQGSAANTDALGDALVKMSTVLERIDANTTATKDD